MTKFTEEQIQNYHNRMLDIIKNHGYAVQAVTAEDPKDRFFYTVGLSMMDPKWPEIIVTGNLDPRTASDIINTAVAKWREQKEATMGIIDLSATFHEDNRFTVIPADKNICDTLMLGIRSYKGDMDYTPVQLLWSTNVGILPTEPGYPHGAYEYIQPMFPVKVEDS